MESSAHKESNDRLEESKRLVEAKCALRRSNLTPERPDSGFLRTLDSSIKRNTAVIKKLKQINEEQREGLLEELKSVNVSKFVSEAVTAICDAKLRSSDINAAVQVCSLLHQRYKDFSPTLIQGLLKVFFPGKAIEDADVDRSLRAMKKRSTLKLLMELYFVGVIEDSSFFINIIKDLTSTEHFKDRDTTQMHLSLLVSFVRQGRAFLGLPLSGQDLHDEIYKELNVTMEQKKFLRKALQSFYDASVELLQSEHSSLRQMEQENAKMLNAKGELSEENAIAYEKLRKSYELLFRSVSALAEALDIKPPVMPEDGHTTRVTTGEDGSSVATTKDASNPEPVWDDEETKAFYESLPDLRAFVPAVLLGEAEPNKTNEQSHKTPEQQQEILFESEQGHLSVPETADLIQDIETSKGEGASDDKSREKEDKERGKETEKDKWKERDTDKKGEKENEKDKVKSLDGPNLDTLLQRLPGCVSRDLIDQLTVDFCYLNSKSNRKKLVRALFNVPRTSLVLLPYYSRMVATLSTCMKDVASMILQLLEEEFNFLINKKDQMNIETKIRNIRFIGELAKFKVAAASLVFSCLKACLDDFTHHNIDVSCNLLETCGRFLYRSPETTIRMANMLEIMMRLKNVKNLDARHSTLVENAYYLCKPPERSARVSKVRPPLHQYVRKLLFSDLDKQSIEHVCRQLRKLPWSECEPYVLKCFMKVYKGKYGQVHLIASLTAGLSRYQEAFAVAVVDEVLEEIRLGLELNDYGMQQRRIAHMRFLGELYNYRLIDSSVIFDTLYLVLFFGHHTAEQDELDPSEDCFRIRMVITALQTCGHFFDKGSSKRRLDKFLLYFQRYILSKGGIPLDVEFDLQDLFAELRPKMIRYSSLEEADAVITELEEQEWNGAPEKTGGERHSDTEGGKTALNSARVAVNGQMAMNGTEENGMGIDDGESGIETESSSLEPDGHEDEEESDEDKSADHDDELDDENEEDDGGEHVPSEEEDVQVRQKKLMEVDPEEEADFERELRAVMQESLDSRKLEIRARTTLNMAIPMNLGEGSREHNRASEVESGDENLDEESGGTNVSFKVLVKKGNKQQIKQLYIPHDCSLVQSTKQKEAAELEEKQDIKRLVLEYNEREEEDSSGATAQPINWPPVGLGAANKGYGGQGGWDGSGRSGSARQRHHLQGSGYIRRR
ncbi:hypothetical protein SUGI_0817920 [Cryptomeria japonica]|uniref:regulator of nonsense transcripts UPF2 n=1 Tax=Cryptomeria japonica TaxID=3369 RepID=UPI002414C923|nr:regulator of nonsense transcripts UPF2 [Cryptomeria japonica]GLJ39978.1 hypothetical protein SUGI_0817920 [Cryptomeria japonica]